MRHLNRFNYTVTVDFNSVNVIDSIEVLDGGGGGGGGGGMLKSWL